MWSEKKNNFRNVEKLVTFDNFFFLELAHGQLSFFIWFYLSEWYIAFYIRCSYTCRRINHNVGLLFVWRIKNYLPAEQFWENLFFAFFTRLNLGDGIWEIENGNWFYSYTDPQQYHRIYLRVYFCVQNIAKK